MSGTEPGRIERRASPHVIPGRRGQVPRAIVVHTTVGNFESAAGWFANPVSEVSAHYLVGLDGRIAQFVDEADAARHAGRVLRPTARLAEAAGPDGLNAITVGIEFEDAGEPLTVDRSDDQYEAGARLIADVAGRWGIPLDRDHVVGHRELFAAKECPGNLDVERLVRGARELREGVPGPLIACLLPIRDAADDVSGYLQSAAALDAAVVALDDGSADDTADLLAASTRVVRLLRNPPRSGFADWDDGENRRRLLAAAAEINPEWLLFLDADERLDADDAQALRDFLAADALPGIAYGLELYREWKGRVVAEPTTVYRLFAHRRGYALRPGRLHFNPVPEQIPRRAWIPTTIRARHLDSPARLDRRRRKYREADSRETAVGPTAALLEPPSGNLVEWRRRPPGLPVLRTAAVTAARSGRDGSGPLIACLLPVRNGAGDLPGYLESAGRFADTVIALDDGSTDETGSLLEASPLVGRVLRRPVRQGYAGWDDAGNRQALLEASIAEGARWAIFLDADERIDAADAAALRSFAEHDADPAAAYGFRVHRMVRTEASYDRAGLWVYRMFAPAPGQRLPGDKLHLVPVPTSIPRERYLKTTVRIQHLGGSDPERRRARLRKYEDADPERFWQSDYTSPLLEEGTARPWRERPAGLPVLADPLSSGVSLDLEELDLEGPVLSAIVIATDDEQTIEASVRAIVEQECPLPFEVIVVVSGSSATAAAVRAAFGEDEVTLVEISERVSPGRARNAGVRVARGDYLSFPGSHVRIAPGSLAHRMRAHERGWAMVTGSIVNGNTTRPGWASYFLDHSTALPGRPSGPLDGAPAHCSYVREFLLEVGGFPEDVRAGEDTVVNNELWRRGHRAYREAAIRLTHHSPCSTVPELVRHHFARGRALGRILRGDFRARPGSRKDARRFLSGYSRGRLANTDQRVADWGEELAEEYRRARPLVRLGIEAARAGAHRELLAARSGAPEQVRDRRHREAPVAQAADDPGKRVGGDAISPVVQDDDRARSG